MTEALRAELAGRKEEILSFLQHARQAAQDAPPPMRTFYRDGELPLSFAQQRLWFLGQLDPGLLSAYNLTIAWRFTGTLQVPVLEQCLSDIVQRHESLRTTFPAQDGRPQQVIAPAQPVTLPVVDLQAHPAAEQEARVQQHATDAAQRPVDLARGPLWCIRMFCLSSREQVLILTLHHMVFDAWSYDILWRELTACYTSYVAGRPPRLPALPIQYADFAGWQQARSPDADLASPLTYWQQHLRGPLTVLQLPTDRPRPSQPTYRGERQMIKLSPSLTAALKALSQQLDATLFMILLAAFKTVLLRYTGQTDVLVGTPVSGRTQVTVENLIGCFINTLVLRTDCGGNPSFRELVERVRTMALDAYAHQDFPFEKLVEALQPERDLSRNPFFQVMFVFQNAPRAMLELPGLTVRPVSVQPGTAAFDLTLSLWDDPEALAGWVDYRSDLFDATTITRMIRHLERVLHAVSANPDQRLSDIPLLTAAERQDILVGWHHRDNSPLPPLCMHQVFEAQVVETSDATAVLGDGRQLTYRMLNQQANQLAYTLRQSGVGPDVLVGLYTERTPETVVGLLGILKAGGAYVPLDPAYPQERLMYVLSDAQIDLIVSQQKLDTGWLPPDVHVINVDREHPGRLAADTVGNQVTLKNLAYVIYTSGSTGRPKGVLVTHAGIANLAAVQRRRFDVQQGSRILQFASLSFDASVFEGMMALSAGGTLCMGPHGAVLSGSDLVQWLVEFGITHVTLPPSVLATLPTAALPALKTIIVAGEACPSDLVATWSPGRRFYNAYGPTEATVWATIAAGDHHMSKPPIGRPIDNVRTYVLDDHLQPVPIGVPGELYIGGIGLARGYLNRPAHTAERFIPHPFSDEPGARLYQTGDRVRYLPDGNLEFLGRLDYQVKIRGYRIEPEEIETVLGQHPAVRETVVVTQQDDAGELYLTAYLVSDQSAAASIPAMRSFLQQKLPAYMMPRAFVWLPALPRTPNGKVDRQALPEPDRSRSGLNTEFVAPRTPTEEVLVGIWETVLGIESVSIHDNFFDLGGHSLVAVQVISRTQDALQAEVPLRVIFDTPTLADLASYIEHARLQDEAIVVVPIRSIPHDGRAPLSVTQEKMWALDRALPGMPFFNMPFALRLTGELQVETLEQSINEIIRRHDALRTVFTTIDDQPVQVIVPALRVAIVMEDLRTLTPSEREKVAQRLQREEALRPFDLEQGPLLRVRLLRLETRAYILLLTMHHIISDGWSMGVLTRELAALYEAFTVGALSPLPALPIQYADFAHWQQRQCADRMWDTQLDYWQAQLHDPLPVLELPTDRPRSSDLGLLGLITAGQAFDLPQALSKDLVRMSRKEGASLFMTLIAAFDILLYQYTGQEDIRVGTLVANRTRQETEGLIGYFANTVILRTNLGGHPTLREVLQRVRAATLAAHAHQDLPFEALVQSLERQRGLQRQLLFQVMLVSQDALQRPLQLPGLTMEGLRTDYVTSTTCDIVLMVNENSRGVRGSCIYKPHLFKATTITRLLGNFQQVLGEVVRHPEQRLERLRPLNT